MDKQTKKGNESKDSNLWGALTFSSLAIIIIWLLSWWLLDSQIEDITERGIFGDKFGALNALFSGLAFAGLIITLHYQKEELKLQRQELAQTRDELKGQREEFEEQNKTLKRQRFENTFFNLLKLQQDIVINITYDHTIIHREFSTFPKIDKKETIQYKGRNLFQEIYLNITISVPKDYSYKGIKGAIQTNEYKIYSQIPIISIFDQYFSHLYQILKYIDSTDLIDDAERTEYTSIIRSQLSSYELVLLFYNGLTENSKLKPLIEKYSLFEDLRIDLLATKQHREKYEESAYNKSH